MAERDDLIAVDPCRKSIALPRRRAPYVPRFLDADQARRLLRGFWGHPLEPWLLVSLTCGLRRCEGCALWWRDIDLREGGVRVDKGLQVVGGEPVEWFTKTPSSVRTVYMRMVRSRVSSSRRDPEGTVTSTSWRLPSMTTHGSTAGP